MASRGRVSRAGERPLVVRGTVMFPRLGHAGGDQRSPRRNLFRSMRSTCTTTPSCTMIDTSPNCSPNSAWRMCSIAGSSCRGSRVKGRGESVEDGSDTLALLSRTSRGVDFKSRIPARTHARGAAKRIPCRRSSMPVPGTLGAQLDVQAETEIGRQQRHLGHRAARVHALDAAP